MAEPSRAERPAFLTRLIATGLFSGYAPIAPGTAGSAVGLVIWWAAGITGPLPGAILIVAGYFAGVAVSARMEAHLGEDPPVVVIDEVVGMWISLYLVHPGLWSAIAAFFLFRLFDIVKPPPARQAEALRNGVGIMLDDVVAGIYANLAVRLLGMLLPAFFG